MPTTEQLTSSGALTRQSGLRANTPRLACKKDFIYVVNRCLGFVASLTIAAPRLIVVLLLLGLTHITGLTFRHPASKWSKDVVKTGLGIWV